jgi:hypothetical protein
MKTIKLRSSDHLADKVAARVACFIVNQQLCCAMWLNKRFNAFSKQQKKRTLIFAGLLFATLLALGLIPSLYTIPSLSQNYTAAHIGQPSELPKPGFGKPQLTDSITIKK